MIRFLQESRCVRKGNNDGMTDEMEKGLRSAGRVNTLGLWIQLLIPKTVFK